MTTTNRIHEYSKKIHFKNKILFEHICSIADQGIDNLEIMLGVEIIPRGHAFLLKSDNEKSMQKAEDFFTMLQAEFTDAERMPDDFDLQYLFKSLSTKPRVSPSNNKQSRNMKKKYTPKDEIIVNSLGQKVFPRTHKQSHFVESVLDNDITICMGPAGTGKTFLSTAVACRLFKKGMIERIVLTRPAVEAGESLGFLPGDLTQKVDPYLRPLYDALYECLGHEKVDDLINLKKIEVAPLAFMRGRSLNKSMVILDEAQNCSLPQLKMFLTRLGRNSKMCISGDITQIDLNPGKSGLLPTSKILQNIDGIALVEFGPEDIVRHSLVEKIVNAFSKNET